MRLITSNFLFLFSLFSIFSPTLGQCGSYGFPCEENCADERLSFNNKGTAVTCPDLAFCERNCKCDLGYCYMGSCTKNCTDTTGMLANIQSCTKDCNCENGFCYTSDQFDSDTNPDHICGVPGTCLPAKLPTLCFTKSEMETCASSCNVDTPGCEAPNCVMDCNVYVEFVELPKCIGSCTAFTKYVDLSACTRDCTAFAQYVDMSSCKENCNCNSGKCDMSSCVGDTCKCLNSDCGSQYSASTYPDGYGISGGALGGIFGGVAVFVAAVIAFLLWKRWKNKQNENTGAEYKPTFPVPDKAQDEEGEIFVAPTVPVVPVIPK